MNKKHVLPVMNILQKSFELDRPLTPELQAIVDMYFQKEQEKKMAEQQAAMEQQQQAEQEQQAQQTQEG